MNHFIDKIDSLIPKARAVIYDKATELPYTNTHNLSQEGSFLCRRCGLTLFRANNQFNASCGWPAFDQNITNTIKETPDADGIRTEIQCNRCEAHLGHVFTGEFFTAKNKRYCVNSLSMEFVGDNTVLDTEEAIVAGGCFWGIDYYMRKLPGVLKIEVGYTGGTLNKPTYDTVCQGNTGHYEAVRVVFDLRKTNYQAVIQKFFEIHDPTQKNGQGLDIGKQYESAIFYYDKQQQTIAQRLILQLVNKGYNVATKIIPVQLFWPAEETHQHYYAKHNKLPYCHQPVERFK